MVTKEKSRLMFPLDCAYRGSLMSGLPGRILVKGMNSRTVWSYIWVPKRTKSG